MKLKIALVINAETKGFLFTMGAILKKKYNCDVIYILRDALVEKSLGKHSLISSEIIRLDKERQKIEITQDVIKEANEYENRYSTLFSYLLSMDRALGQGYFFNVAKVPNIGRSRWSHQEKIHTVLKEFKLYEELLSDVDILIQHHAEPIINIICRKNDCPAFSLAQARFGGRYLWSDNDYLTSSLIIGEINKLVSTGYGGRQGIDYEVDGLGATRISQSVDILGNTSSKLFRVFINDVKRILLGNYNKDSYGLFGWAPAVIRESINLRYYQMKSVKPDEISNQRLAFFTLHVEPEVSLFQYSPEFTNVYEAITWFSKSLPADVLLIIKEHPIAMGVRSKSFYDFLGKIPNVKLADVKSLSSDWLQRASLVGTITGSVGFEAIYYNVPVVSFGKHQLINNLPSVEYVSNYLETKRAVKRLLHGDNLKTHTDDSKFFLHQSIMRFSFELPGYIKCIKEDQLEFDLANVALNNLMASFPSSFKHI